MFLLCLSYTGLYFDVALVGTHCSGASQCLVSRVVSTIKIATFLLFNNRVR